MPSPITSPLRTFHCWLSVPVQLTAREAQLLDGETHFELNVIMGEVELIIPPGLGYGATAQSKIPGNSTLVFVIDLHGVS